MGGDDPAVRQSQGAALWHDPDHQLRISLSPFFWNVRDRADRQLAYGAVFQYLLGAFRFHLPEFL